MSTFENIIYEKENGRVRIILSRPEKMNALTMALMEELNEALWEADNDTSVHCVILKGEGRCFSAGYDLTAEQSGIPTSRITDLPIWRLTCRYDFEPFFPPVSGNNHIASTMKTASPATTHAR